MTRLQCEKFLLPFAFNQRKNGVKKEKHVGKRKMI